jgi:transposase-like protein
MLEGINVSKVTPEKKAKFLSVLAEGGSVTQAARAIGIACKNVYAWRNKDQQFKADWEDAVEQGTDCLKDEAVRGTKDHSNTLLIFLLKGRRKERYAERQEHTGKNGGPITLRQWLDEHSGKTLGPPSERAKLANERGK